MADGWYPDVLGHGFQALTLPLADDGRCEVVATLVRAPTSESGRAVLYLHGFNDYFFQADLARWYTERGWAFYAIDLRAYGRSLRPHQTPNHCVSLADYDEELDAAVAVVRAEGHREILLMGHSTGGLTLSLWAARRRHLPLAGLILNSPFLQLRQPPVAQTLLIPVIRGLAKIRPSRVLPAKVSGVYGESLHASRRGEWDYDLTWKPIESFPITVGWLAAVAAGQRLVRAGLGLSIPVLSLSSTRTVTARTLKAREWSPQLQTGDAVLDATDIATASVRLGDNLTCIRIPDGMHDLILSPLPARDRAYAAMDTWLQAWVPAPGRRPGAPDRMDA